MICKTQIESLCGLKDFHITETLSMWHPVFLYCSSFLIYKSLIKCGLWCWPKQYQSSQEKVIAKFCPILKKVEKM